MIRSITVTNLENGSELKLTLTSPETSQGFAVVDCTGLGPGQATINTSDWVTVDGGYVESTRLPKRTINLTLRLIPTEYWESVADIRRRSYKYFPIKKQIRLLFECVDYKNRVKKYFIEGVVEKNNPNIWSEAEECAISIVCPSPYFQNAESKEVDFNLSVPLFHFEFPDDDMGHPYPVSELLDHVTATVYNTSTMDIGVIFYLYAGGTVKNINIYNTTTNERMLLNMTLNRGDTLIIDTRPGHKSIRTNDGFNTNKLQYLALDSKWITIRQGENNIGWWCDEGGAKLKAKYKITELYQGI